MTGGAAVCVQGEEQGGENTALWGAGAGGPGGGEGLPYPHSLHPVCDEVSNPLADGVRHLQLGKPKLQDLRVDGVEGRAEVHKQDPGIGARKFEV